MKNSELQELLKNRNGLKFNLNDTSNKKDILFRTLENRGINDLDSFNNPKPDKDFKPSNPFKLFNSIYWSQYLIKKVKEGKDFYIVVDNDADGFSSSAYLYMYFKTVFKTTNIHFLFSKGKAHGIHTILKKILNLQNAFVLIPDASVPLEDQELLNHNSIDYLIIDHHDLQDEDKVIDDYLPIFNNQYSSNKSVNKEFTGVGMVYELCKMLDYYLGLDVAKDFLYFLSIGQVGDVSDVSNLEIRHLVLKGFDILNRSLLIKDTTNVQNPSAHELSFSIIPKINAVCRTGNIHEKEMLMNGLVGAYDPYKLITITKRKKSPFDNKFHMVKQDIDYYNWVARKLNTIKSRQNRTVKKSLGSLNDIKETKSFIVAIDKENKLAPTETGLLATKLSNKYQKPTIVLHPTKTKDRLGGSARGFIKIMKDFKQFCLSTKLFVFCAGHPNAFGIAIDKDNLDKFINNFNYDFSNDISYDIDNIYVDNVPMPKEITDFDSNRSYFGGKVLDPELGFIGLNVGLNTMKIRGSVMSFKVNGVSFTKFNTSSNLKDKLLNHNRQNIYFDIVGKPNINNFMKYSFPQIIIDDIKITNSVKQNKQNNNDMNLIYDEFLF